MYTLKSQPEDFVVIEDLSIPFSGSGEHLWLYVEKQNLTTDIVRSILSRVFSVGTQQVSYAGKKDRHGITRQWFSLQLPGSAEKVCPGAQNTLASYQEQNPLYEGERLEILQAQVHLKKCQRGCHQGNFFELKVQTDQSYMMETLTHAASLLEQNGFPNYFGDQRFGDNVQSIDDVNQALIGIHRKAKRSRLKPREAWTCSQARAFLFNKVLDARLELAFAHGNGLSHVIEGDLMNLQGSASCFLVEPFEHDKAEQQEEQTVLQQRSNQGDIVPTGPLFGDQRGQLQPQGLILDIEQNVLSLLTPDAQVQLEKLQESGRRPMIVRPRNMLCQSFDNGIELKFWLPKGAYATECVRYFIASLSERVVKQNVKA